MNVFGKIGLTLLAIIYTAYLGYGLTIIFWKHTLPTETMGNLMMLVMAPIGILVAWGHIIWMWRAN